MRLLHVISSINPLGGGPIEGIRQLRRPVTNLGVEVDIVCCDSPNASWVSNYDISSIVPLGPSSKGYNYNSRLVPWLIEHATAYDAIIVNGIWQYHSFAVWRALAGSGIPYFVFTHGMLDPWFKHTYPFKHVKKWLYWPWAEYRVLRDARAVLFTCEEERLLARESFWLYRCNERVVNYGTSAPVGDSDLQKEAFLAGFPQLRGKRLWLFLSRIHPKKACDHLIRAFAETASQDKTIQLVIAGPDQVGWVKELQQLGKSLDIADRITWPGMLSGDLKWGAFHAAEVFVLPSHQENFGIAVAEALACGLPVLISNKVNIWREIEQDGAGLVADDTLEGCRCLLARWLSMPESERAGMRDKAKRCFLDRFEITQAARSLVDTIQGLI